MQYLFYIEIFCNVNNFTVTFGRFNVSMLKKKIYFKKNLAELKFEQ